MLLGSPTQRPLRTYCLLSHGVSNLNQWLVQPVSATIELGGIKEKCYRLNRTSIFVSARHWSARLVACKTTLVVGGLCILVVSVLQIGALPTDVGAEVAT